MRAFSLVELSIVLVILGLLVGGILAGQSLIHAAELRAVSSEYQRYRTAIYAFRDKYLGLPGDITTATNFWGAADGSTGTTRPAGRHKALAPRPVTAMLMAWSATPVPFPQNGSGHGNKCPMPG